MASWTYDATWVYKKSYSAHDPVQGNAKDCYLMAALSSLAWICRVNIKSPDGSGNVKLTLGGKDYTAAKTEELPVDTGGNLYCARSAGGPKETWPAIYEKLYARFLGLAPDPNSPNNPDISGKMDEGNPLTALAAVTGWTPSSETSANYQKIFSNLTASIQDTTKENGNKTKYPVVAWTYPSLSISSDTAWAILPKHSYSVLGTYGEYIVLRNPSLGPLVANAGITLITSGTWAIRDRCYQRSAAEYRSIYPITGAALLSLSFDLSKRLFAIKGSEFPSYFEGFGWAY